MLRPTLTSCPILLFSCVLLAGQTRDLRLEPIDPVTQRAFQKQVKVALVVGISAYPQGSGLSSLKYAARDAEVLGATLKSQGYLVRQLTESDATRAMIRRSLRELSDAVSPNEGTILFFFGGHGFTYKGSNYLATFGVTADDLDGEGLAVKDVEELLLASKAKRKLLFIDACRNDPGQAARSTGQRSFEKLQAAEGIRVLFSTKEGRVSFEDDGLRQGVFTYFLAKGLKGEAAGADGLVTFRDLADYVTDRMRAYTVERGQLQIPFEAGESSGDFLLSAGSKGGGLPPAAQAPVALREPEKTPPLSVAPPELVKLVPQARTTKVNEKDGLTYVWIPPGTFQMGCSPGDGECHNNEKPAHQVTLTKGYWMGQTPVTQEAYQRVAGNNPSYFKGAKLPVETVSWNDAQSYCQAVGLRLPTEAEWEYAARGGTAGSRYGELDQIAWTNANSGKTTHAVGQKQANAFGLYDMLGNVFEWVTDWYAWYPTVRAPDGPPDGQHRVMRGGSWYCDAGNARASSRSFYRPWDIDVELGLRCAGN